jgi:SAM-dependent methyltransferase
LISKIKKALRPTMLGRLYSSYIFWRIKKDKVSTFLQDRADFKLSEQNTKKRFEGELVDNPLLDDKTSVTDFEPHYTYHPAWAARILAKTRPEKHIDISSILHFSTLVSAFVPVDFYDYRPANVILDNLSCKHGDLLNLPFADNTVNSLSCMHTLEHIGLGRYGDAIDYDGDLKAINELKRVLAVGGNLIIVTPIGQEKIEFNAHRIYSYEQVISFFSGLHLVEFSLVADNFENGIIKDAKPSFANEQAWGCGCFWFTKLA